MGESHDKPEQHGQRGEMNDIHCIPPVRVLTNGMLGRWPSKWSKRRWTGC